MSVRDQLGLDLLDDHPISRNTDPATSRLAAQELTASGTRASQQRAVMEALERVAGGRGARDDISHRPPISVTSAELAVAMNADRYMVARRLPELRNAELAANGVERTCRISGRKCGTWMAL